MLISDFRYAVRMIRKTPGASAVAILSLALGIGANTAIFSLMDTVLLKMLPVKSPQELFIAATSPPPRTNMSWNYPDYVAMRDRNHSFSGLAAAGLGIMPLGMQMADRTGVTPGAVRTGSRPPRSQVAHYSRRLVVASEHAGNTAPPSAR